ncbi:MAG: FAD-dependent oxidoreductase [Bacteroidota bacterium]
MAEIGGKLRIGIVGGGVAGLFSAWYLARLGQERIALTLLDRGEPGHGTSWDAAGMLAPVNEIEFQELPLFRAGLASRALYDSEVVPALPDIGFRRAGTVEIGLHADDTGYLKRLYEFQRAQGQAVEWLTGPQIRAREPFITQDVGPGIWSEVDAQVDNRKLVAALVADLKRRGVEVLSPREVYGYRANESGGVVLETTAGELPLDRVLLAPGVPSEALKAQLPYKIYPVKGEMLALDPPRESSQDFLRATVRIRSKTWGSAYVVPKTGRILCGSTSEERGLDRRLTAGGMLDILRKCYAAVPGIYELDIQETWAGLRPSTLSRQPLLAADPRIPGAYHLNGLFRHGILLGPLFGRAAARLILDGSHPPEVAEFGLPEF